MAQPTRQIEPLWHPRLANEGDVQALEALIPLSVRSLQAPYYSTLQMDLALGTIFAVDRQLIHDRTYFVVEREGQIIGCGGWSKRLTLFGGDHARNEPDPLLDPCHDPARVRAFFVHPNWARKGIGRAILLASERSSIAAGFLSAQLVATLSGVPLYADFGYRAIEHFEIPMSNGVALPVVRMAKTFASNHADS